MLLLTGNNRKTYPSIWNFLHGEDWSAHITTTLTRYTLDATQANSCALPRALPPKIAAAAALAPYLSLGDITMHLSALRAVSVPFLKTHTLLCPTCLRIFSAAAVSNWAPSVFSSMRA
jgi:hypothetical protein